MPFLFTHGGIWKIFRREVKSFSDLCKKHVNKPSCCKACCLSPSTCQECSSRSSRGIYDLCCVFFYFCLKWCFTMWFWLFRWFSMAVVWTELYWVSTPHFHCFFPNLSYHELDFLVKYSSNIVSTFVEQWARTRWKTRRKGRNRRRRRPLRQSAALDWMLVDSGFWDFTNNTLISATFACEIVFEAGTFLLISLFKVLIGSTKKNLQMEVGFCVMPFCHCESCRNIFGSIVTNAFVFLVPCISKKWYLLVFYFFLTFGDERIRTML